jgi:ketosteroid isomerase-like protein
MRVRLITATALAAPCASGPVLAQQGGAMSEQAVLAAADSMTRRFVSAYNAGNPSGIAALFATGGVYLTPAGTILTNPQRIEKAIASRIKAGWTKETVRVIAARSAGDAVWDFGEYAIVGTGANSGKQIGGNFAAVLTREGSQWRIAMLIGNLKPVRDVTGMAGATAK